MGWWRLILLGAAVLMLGAHSSPAETNSDFSFELGAQGRYFPTQPAYDPQQPFDVSLSGRPTYSLQWDNRRQTFVVQPFFRWDQADPRRTHFDISDLSYVKAWDSFEVRAGVRKVFWGVTESQHLVNIINQTDYVEDFSGNAWLGQPMVSGAALTGVGNFEVFVMPYFRERTYPGVTGHFRAGAVVNTDAATYESPNGRYNPDVAARWSDHLGVFDIGLSHFYGTNRTPTLIPRPSSTGGMELDPYYQLINQSGLDVQMTTGNLTGKLEAITRGDRYYNNAYFAATGGGEYTFPQVFGALDIGLLGEYMYDSRGKSAPVAYDDDFYAGLRVTLNSDPGGFNVLAGAICDRTTDNEIFQVGTSRRFGAEWKVGLKGGWFHITKTVDPLYAYYRDNFIQAEVTYYFMK